MSVSFRKLATSLRSYHRIRLSLAQSEAVVGYVMVLPWLLGFLVFSLGPVAATLYFSFTRYNVLAPPEYIGLDNFSRAFTADPLFWQSLTNTFYYVAISVPLGMLLSFSLAYLLNLKLNSPLFKTYRVFLYLPYIVPSVAASVIWVWLLNNQVGIINYVLGLVDLRPVPWLVNQNWSKPALIIVNLWWRVGGTMVIYLAALQSAPRELYEAAEVDGAGWWSKLIHVTLPLLAPTIFFTLVLGVIDSFQVFNSAFIMTAGGPLNSTLFYVLYIYNNAFRYFEMGYASALAWILFLFVLAFTVLLFRGSRDLVYYEGEVAR